MPSHNWIPNFFVSKRGRWKGRHQGKKWKTLLCTLWMFYIETFLCKENWQISGLGLLCLLSCQLSMTVLQTWIREKKCPCLAWQQREVNGTATEVQKATRLLPTPRSRYSGLGAWKEASGNSLKGRAPWTGRLVCGGEDRLLSCSCG